MENLQPLLSSRKGIHSDLCVTVSPDNATLTVFLGVLVLERIPNDPSDFFYRLFLGRLINMGFKAATLQRVFSHDSRTLRRWAQAAASGEPEEMIRVLSGRGGSPKITAAVERFIKLQYRSQHLLYRDYRRRIASQVESVFRQKISREVLRQLFRAADAEDACGCLQPASSLLSNTDISLPSGAENSFSENPLGVAFGCPVPHETASFSDNQTPAVMPHSGVPIPPQPTPVHHAGQILFCFLMDVLIGGIAGAKALASQLIGQILQGAVNLEQSGAITGHDLALFAGLTAKTIKAQHDQVNRAATAESTLDIYRANNRLLADGPGTGTVYYYDPHSKEYSGMSHILKGWCGKRHTTAKVINLDVIHTVSGRPCFIEHYDSYYDLRERIFMTLDRFDQLFPAPLCCGRIFIIDRGIYGLATFDKLLERKDHLITWEKGYSKGSWDESLPATEFSRTRHGNSKQDSQHYHFAYQSSLWSRDKRFIRYIVRATNPQGRTIEVSVLCSAHHLSGEDAISKIFNRWIQENDFKYLDIHFGLMQISSYRSRPYADIAETLKDRPVDCPEYRDLKKKCRDSDRELSRILLIHDKKKRQFEELQAECLRQQQQVESLRQRLEAMLADVRRSRWNQAESAALRQEFDAQQQALKAAQRRAEAAATKLRQIEEQLQPLREENRRLEIGLCDILRDQSKLKLLIDGRYCRLETNKKAYLDALKITAANMFRNLHQGFRPLYGNYRDDHVQLRKLTRSDGFLCLRNGIMQVDLWLKGTYQARQIRAFNAFLGLVTRGINIQFEGRCVPVDIRLVDSTAEVENLVV